jgi:hypothetical protein
MTNDDDKDALEAAKKARWETGEWCGDSVEQFEAGWYAHHDMTKGRTTNDAQDLDGPALKCPNPDCWHGNEYQKGTGDERNYLIRTGSCPTCLGTGEKP